MRALASAHPPLRGPVRPCVRPSARPSAFRRDRAMGHAPASWPSDLAVRPSARPIQTVMSAWADGINGGADGPFRTVASLAEWADPAPIGICAPLPIWSEQRPSGE
jgi:hypothetical protein